MDIISPASITDSLILLRDPFVYFFIVVGSFLGFIFGATPGLTAPAAIALVLPITYSLNMQSSMAFLLGIYVSGYFAGSFPAILLNTPGTPGNAATAIDGYQMSKNGRGHEAMTAAVISSFFGVFLSVVILLTFAPFIAKVALSFTSVEYCLLSVFGLLCVAGVSNESKIKGLAAALFGVLISTVGLDAITGVPRYTFGFPDLLGGVAIIPLLIGLFAISEMIFQSNLSSVEHSAIPEDRSSHQDNILRNHLINKWLTLKSGLIGAFIGALPGTGPAIASWIAYGESVRTSKPGDKYGKGDVKGVIACETSNNAVVGGAMIPLLTLGIPGDPVTAVLVGALMIQGVEPGPFFIRDNGGFFITIIVILLLSNIVMAILGLCIRNIAVRILVVPKYIIVPVVVSISVTAVYAVSYSSFDLWLLGFFGLIGFFLLKTGFPIAPVVLGVVLGQILEINLRNVLVVHGMDLSVFLTRPISALLLISIALLVFKYTYNQGDR